MSNPTPDPTPSPDKTPDSQPAAASVDKPSAEASPTDQKPGDEKTETKAGSKKPREKKPGRWRRRLTFTAVVLLAVAVVGRILIGLMLPFVLHKAAAFYDLNLDYERMQFSALDGEVAIWHLKVTPTTGGEPLAEVGYIHGEISVIALLEAQLLVWRAEADGVVLNIVREADGRVPVIERFMTGPPSKSRKWDKIDLTPPLAVDAFRLSHIRAHLRDLSVSPNLDTTCALDLRVSDVASASRPTQFEVDVRSDPLLDSLHVEGEGQASGLSLDANINVAVHGIHPGAAAGYLSLMGLKPIAQNLDMTMHGHVRTGPAGTGLTLTTQPSIPANTPVGGTAGDALAALIELKDLKLKVDQVDAAVCDAVTINADKVTPGEVSLKRIDIGGVRCGAGRNSEGLIQAAGLEMTTAAKGANASASASASSVTPPAQPATPLPPIKVSIADLLIHDVEADFDDMAVQPQAHLAFVVDQLRLQNIHTDPAAPDKEVKIAGAFRSPDMVRSITIDGAAKPFSQQRDVTLAVRATGIKPDAIKPYLQIFGMESSLHDASFGCDLTATANVTPAGIVTGNASMKKLTFADDKELLALNSVDFDGIRIDPDQLLFHIDKLQVTGPALSAKREADGTLAALGFLHRPGATRTQPPSISSQESTPKTVVDQTHPSLSTKPTQVAKTTRLPTLEIVTMVWKDIKFDFDDLGVSPHSPVSLTDAGVELSNLRIDLNSDKRGQPGTFNAWLALPHVADRLAVNGTITPGSKAVSLDMHITGKGLSGDIAKPYFAVLPLTGMTIEPALNDGRLDCHAKVDVGQTPDGFNVALSADGITYADGDRELAGVDLVQVDGVATSKSGISIANVDIKKPRASIIRDTDGSFLVAGLRIATTQPAAEPEDAPTSIAATSTPLGTVAHPATNPTSQPAATQPAEVVEAETPFVAEVKKLMIEDASLAWSDRAVTPSVATAGHLDLELDSFVFGKPADPADLHIMVRADGVLDQMTVGGKVFAAANAATAHLEIKGNGLKAGPLASYLPPTVKVTLADGRFGAKIDAACSCSKSGAASGWLIVDDVDYRDGESGPSLLKMDDATIRLAHANFSQGADHKKKLTSLAVDEVTMAGLETSAIQTASDLRMLGISVAGASPSPATQPSAAIHPAATQSSVAAAPAAPVVVKKKVNAAELLAASHEALPLVSLEKLDLNISKLLLTDESRPGSAPLAVSNIRVWNPERIDVLGDHPEAKPPIKLEVTCRVLADAVAGAYPVVDRVDVKATVNPFLKQQPFANVVVMATGINGDGLTALAPELTKDPANIDGSGLKAGQFQMALTSHLKLDRRSPIDFDVSHGFDLDFDLKDVQYRSEPGGEILAGVDEVQTEGARVNPMTSTVQVHTLEISTPRLRAYRDKDGVHALGLLVKIPETPTTKPATAAPTKRSAPPVPASNTPVATTTLPPAKPAGEVCIDKLVISGLNAMVEDRSVTPPLVVPLNGLEVEVLGLTSNVMTSEKPFRFDALVNAGKVPLPSKKAAGTMEDRDLFSQVDASGKLSFVPQSDGKSQPKGYVKASVSGFEMAALKGEAQANKMDLSGGTLDTDTTAKFDGLGDMDAKAKAVITDLSYKEAPNGPLQSILKLPAPMDIAIGVVEDASGSITFPLDNIHVDKRDGISYGSVIGSATGAVASVFVTALASAPLKAANLVGNILGLGGPKAEEQKTYSLQFPPGSTALEQSAMATLAPLLKRLRNEKDLTVTLTQTMGVGDGAIADARANPNAQDRNALEYSLHNRKLQLQATRLDLAERAHGELAAYSPSGASDTLTRLKAIDRELAQTEDALDRVCDLMRPGAENRKETRTKAASIEIGIERLVSVQTALTSSGIPDIQHRVKAINPKYDAAATGVGQVTITAVPKK